MGMGTMGDDDNGGWGQWVTMGCGDNGDGDNGDGDNG